MHGTGARRLAIGAMTGTSIDGIDLALVEVIGHGLGMTARFLRGRSASLDTIAPRLRAAAEQVPLPAREFAALALDLGSLHAAEMRALAEHSPIDLAVVHGQTIAHAPPASWQLINPFPIAAALRCPVLCDLRQADLAAGGQGAPITPLADWVLLRSSLPRVILNLGGFANATALPSSGEPLPGALEAIRGADLCACNHLLDRAARRALGVPFDRDGAAAARGRVDPGRAADLEARLDRQRAEGRSLGTGDEISSWVDAACPSLGPDDAVATTVAAVAASIARGVRALAPDAAQVLVAGGGVRNRALLGRLADALPASIAPTDAIGLPAEYREAAEMAVLGALARDGVAISLPAVTGRRDRVAMDGLLCLPAAAAASPGGGP